MSKALSSQNISVLILSGGRARRMNGVDKGFVELNGKPMIRHILDNLGSGFKQTMISTNRVNAAYRELGCDLIADKLTGSLGPLAGIHAGLCEAKTKLVFVVPCDTPYISKEVCQRLYHALETERGLMAVAYDGQRLHATVAVIDVSVRKKLEHYLLHGGRRMMSWYKEQAAIEVDCADLKPSFININTLTELERIQQKE